MVRKRNHRKSTHPDAIHVAYVDLGLQHKSLNKELTETFQRVMSSGIFVLGAELEALEAEFASYCDCRYAVGVGNGTDAIALTLRSLDIGPGDEVVTVPNSFLATAAAIIQVGAKPIFVDIRDDFNINADLIVKALTKRTKAIMPVHLTGRPADMNAILEIADRNKLFVIEDAAQAVGAEYNGRRVGSIGTAGCFSFHPLKNLNACGDGGMVVTNEKNIRDYIRKARNHGLQTRDICDFWGVNSRLDEIQAAILRVKLSFIDKWIQTRRSNAFFYREYIGNAVKVPEEKPCEYSVYHTFMIQTDFRNELKNFLKTKDIDTKIHYPIPIHLQKASKTFGYSDGDFPVAEALSQRILSLPIHCSLSEEQLHHVADSLNLFFSTYKK